MATAPQPPDTRTDRLRSPELERNRREYRYREPERNQLHPIASADAYPSDAKYTFRWKLGIGGRYLRAQTLRFLNLLRFRWQRLRWRFDKMDAYRQVLGGDVPGFVKERDEDDAFGWWRIAGANPLSLTRVDDLAELQDRIRIQVGRIEASLAVRLNRGVSLEAEVRAGRLFEVDFKLLQKSLRPAPTHRPAPSRDSRWRAKYLPTPLGVFLEVPGIDGRCELLPLAIQVDQAQPRPAPGERNPVVYPDDHPWEWRLAKAYFEVADLNYHVFCGHVFRTHLLIEPFAMATPRQLSKDHAVRVLLEPHLRFTLPVNREAYRYFTSRKKTYYDFYAGTLEESRAISIESYEDKGFRELEIEAELSGRGVLEHPRHYPYRDDAKLWRIAIRRFVGSYVTACFASDAEVADDPELQAWALELMDPAQGAVRDLTPGGRLDTRDKLIDVLAQVVYTAGPGHASQHYSSNHFYCYAPAFPGAAYVPPRWEEGRASEARFQNLLPPIATAARQWTYNTFTNYQYDTFGDYEGYALGRKHEAQEPIRVLNQDLKGIEEVICAENRSRRRLYPYTFLLPSQVPNSINI